MTTATRIGRLHLTGATADSPALRLAVARQLGAAEVRPPALPPAAILVVRQLRDPAPGKLQADAWRLPGDWERAIRDSLSELVGRAAYPADGVADDDAEAVIFRDPAELWACLLLDRCHRQATSRWWWSRMAIDLEQPWPEAIAARIELLPAICDHFLRHRQLEPWRDLFTPKIAAELLPALVSRLQLPAELLPATTVAPSRLDDRPGEPQQSADAVLRERPGRDLREPPSEASAAKPHHEACSGSNVPSPPADPLPEPWSPWLPAETSSWEPHQRALFGLCRLQVMAPLRCHQSRFRDQARAWWRAANRPPRERSRERSQNRRRNHNVESTYTTGAHRPRKGSDLTPAGPTPSPSPWEVEPTDGIAPAQATDAPRPRSEDEFAQPSPGTRSEIEATLAADGEAGGHPPIRSRATRRRPSDSPTRKPEASTEASPTEEVTFLPITGKAIRAAAPESIQLDLEALAAGISTAYAGLLFLLRPLDELAAATPEVQRCLWQELTAIGLTSIGEDFAADPLAKALSVLACHRFGSNFWPPSVSESPPTATNLLEAAGSSSNAAAIAGSMDLRARRWEGESDSASQPAPALRRARRSIDSFASFYRLPHSWHAESAAPICWARAGGRLCLWRGEELLADVPTRPLDQARSELGLAAQPCRRPMASAPRPRLPLTIPATAGSGLGGSLEGWLARALPALEGRLRRAGAELLDLLTTPGRLFVTSSHLDLLFDLDAISLPARRAGLDRDPGWLARCGRVVLFHFR
ncbi:MAG: hypothetical protein AAF604_16165 [Acidobacteriota bacterium]